MEIVTLLTLLSQQDPDVALDNDLPTSLSLDGCLPITKIEEWREFNFDNTWTAYELILGQIAIQNMPEICKTSNVTMTDAMDVYSILDSSLSHGVNSVLPPGPGLPGHRITAGYNHFLGGKEDLCASAILWGTEVLFVGIMRRAADWDNFDEFDLRHPWAQIARQGRTRFAYIVTETAVIACQVCHANNRPKRLIVRKRVVPFDPCPGRGNDVLTPMLALWALGMMAADTEDHDITSVSDTPQLNHWRRIRTALGKRLGGFKNVMSGRTLPSPPGAMWTN